MRILIADDHPVVRRGLRQILEQESDLVLAGEASDGSEALNLARKLKWDVAVLDYSMPGRSGLDLLKEIKREYPKRPVLVLSMHPEELHATRVLRAGGAGYLTKDAVSDELVVAIRKVAGGGRYVSPALAERIAVEMAPDSNRPRHEMLSDREYRVMWFLASGVPINQIAKELFLSPSTVSTYRTRILKKLDLANNAQLVQYAIRNHLVA